ncbi:large ribosomal subunit protein cL38 [Cornus florida]|uniref:large ribosomal subunit protein cL38 n=1 Tax=Cornus florida TaxID=4283 RepID=UPI00289DE863|nr:large ribosomal subunit protein cL38 [Cornus florida]
MSVSAILGCRVAVVPNTCSFSSSVAGSGAIKLSPIVGANGGGGGGGGLVIECSSRPKKKATAHHRKTRPKKTQLWDIKRGPTVYPPLPPLPPDWTFLVSDDAVAVADPPPQPLVTQ